MRLVLTYPFLETSTTRSVMELLGSQKIGEVTRDFHEAVILEKLHKTFRKAKR